MKKYLGALGILLLSGMLFSVFYFTYSAQPVTAAPAEVVVAAPAFAPTPVAGITRGSRAVKTADFYATKVITADQVSTCLETAGFDVMDAHWIIDQGGPSNNNTTTLTLLYTNDKAIPSTQFDVGPAIASANTADVADMQQFAVFGRYTCVDVNVTNARVITLTLKTIVK